MDTSVDSPFDQITRLEDGRSGIRIPSRQSNPSLPSAYQFHPLSIAWIKKIHAKNYLAKLRSITLGSILSLIISQNPKIVSRYFLSTALYSIPRNCKKGKDTIFQSFKLKLSIILRSIPSRRNETNNLSLDDRRKGKNQRTILVNRFKSIEHVFQRRR